MKEKRRHSNTGSTGIAVNPFYIYALFFGGAVIFYYFKWSSLYPDLSPIFLLFLFVTLSISSLLGLGMQSKLRRALRSRRPSRLHVFWYWALLLVYFLEFAYAGGIPLLWILSGREFIYEDFGLPSVHVFTMTFGCFFSLVKFDEYLNTLGRKSVKAFLWASLPILFDLAIVSRGFVSITLVAWFFIFCMNRKPSIGRVISVISTIVVLGLGFATLGDLRTASRNDQALVENLVLELGDATESFRASSIPAAAFWPYLYATSPLANLQNTIDFAEPRLSPTKTVELVIAELLPDFISKRIMEAAGWERLRPVLVTPALTVATVYAASFAYLGWAGMCMMFICISMLVVLYIALLPYNRYVVPSLAMISTFVAFCIFDNMIYFSGLSLQLAWPLLLSVRMWSRAKHPLKSVRFERAVIA